jgi:hypothetical protein
LGDGLAYREAYTTAAAEAVVEHLVTHRGLVIDRDAAPEPGKIVFVYRKTQAAATVLSAISNEAPAFHKAAA